MSSSGSNEVASTVPCAHLAELFLRFPEFAALLLGWVPREARHQVFSDFWSYHLAYSGIQQITEQRKGRSKQLEW